MKHLFASCKKNLQFADKCLSDKEGSPPLRKIGSYAFMTTVTNK